MAEVEGDLNDLSHQEVFEVRVSALGDLITEGLMNTLALDANYAATTFEVREMVADLRLIKIGDRSDLIETYAVESTYGYYIVDAGLRTQVLQEMLIQQPERVDQDRELILGFVSLEAVNFLRGDIASRVNRYCQITSRLEALRPSKFYPAHLAESLELSELTNFPVIPAVA